MINARVNHASKNSEPSSMSNKIINVIKRDGSSTPLDIDKLHKVVEWSCEGLSGVSPSELEISAQLRFYDGIRTTDIQETLIKSAADLISVETPNYQYVAARLINYHLRKEVYGQYEPWTVKKLVERNVAIGHYTPELLQNYDDKEFDDMQRIIKHKRDDNFAFAGMEQLRGKYLVKDRVLGTFFETPQFIYLLIGATLFMDKPKDERMKWVKDFYDSASQFEISLPTPIMAGVRTPEKQFSSCVVIDTADSLKSIQATNCAVMDYISERAGIGVGYGRVRAVGSGVRNNTKVHTGIKPFLSALEKTVKSCSQGGLRGGSATVHFALWHREFETIIELKNNKGRPEDKINKIDYSFLMNKTLLNRLINGGDISFFSPSEVPGLFDAFARNDEEFRILYEKYEADPSIKRVTRKAEDVFVKLMSERKETGRQYIMFIDNVNQQGSYIPELAAVVQSNLCQEITLPSSGLGFPDDPDGWISLCTLAAVNQAKINKPSDYERPCRVLVQALDALLTYQSYPVRAAETTTKNFRPLGVGWVNLAYWLAKNGYMYGDDAGLRAVDEYASWFAYYLTDESINLAKEKGPAPWLEKSKYGNGVLPIDVSKRDILIKDIFKGNVEHDTAPWEILREKLVKYGIRNTTLMAFMPSETSSQVLNATNGIEPPRALISQKKSKDGVLSQVVPEVHKLKYKYDLLWDQRGPQGYLKVMAVLQQYIDQSISTNTSYNPDHYPNREIPMSDMLRDMLLCHRWGIKTLYYFNTKSDEDEEKTVDDINTSTEDNKNVIGKLTPSEFIEDFDDMDEDDCESCKI